jgi:hypothetical protein
MLRALGVLIVLSMSVGVAEASCQFIVTRVPIGFDSVGSATVDSGKACGLGIREGVGATLSSFAVLKQPDHGRVGIGRNGYNFWVYRSDPGYRGPDHFIGVMTGASSKLGTSGTSKVDITIDVQ